MKLFGSSTLDASSKERSLLLKSYDISTKETVNPEQALTVESAVIQKVTDHIM